MTKLTHHKGKDKVYLSRFGWLTKKDVGQGSILTGSFKNGQKVPDKYFRFINGTKHTISEEEEIAIGQLQNYSQLV